MKIIILIASVRTGRKSNRVALYFDNYIKTNSIGETKFLDLAEYQFPVFDERLRYQKEPTQKMLEFSKEIKSADGIIIVTPEYNGGFSANLKNVVDLLYDEWKRKTIAITTVFLGAFGGYQVITSLLFTLWKIGAMVVPAMFPVSKVEEAFDENGLPSEKEKTDKRAKTFVDELVWCMNAAKGK